MEQALRSESPADNHAWAAFFVAERRALTAYALSLTGSLDAAQDLLQDVLVSMVQQRRSVDHARPYVMACLRNRAIDRRRRPQVATMGEIEMHAREVLDSSEGALTQREAVERVRDALDRLPAERQEIIVLKVFARMPFREIAEVLNRPMGSVTSDYARAIDALRQILDPEVLHA